MPFKKITISVLLSVAGMAGADPGDVLWYFEIPSASQQLHRPSIGGNGTIYWSVHLLYAISPGGQLLWSRPHADPNPVGIGADGTLYVGGWRPPPNSNQPALKAFAPNGDHLWDFSDMGLVVGFLGGPNVGPDGNVYAVMYGGTAPNPPGFGAFSLTPGGVLRWHVDGFGNDAGTPSSEIVFGNGNMYKSEYNAPMPVGQSQSGLIAIETDGDIAWRHSIGIPSISPSRHPCVSPLNGNVHLTIPTRTLRTYTPSGGLAWFYTGGFTPTGFGEPAAGPDGSVYVINGSLHLIALNAQGGVRWIAQNIVPHIATAPEVSPDGSLVVFGTSACNGGACAGRVVGVSTADGSIVFDRALPQVPGGVPSAVTKPRFSNDGSVVYLGADAFTAFTHSYLFAIEIAPSGGCYANCDQSTTEPVLNVADFSCFLQKFATGAPYANCDASTTPPVLNVADFGCFLQEFAAGCR